MMSMSHQHGPELATRHRIRTTTVATRLVTVGILTGLMGVTGCDGLLDVEVPGQIAEASLQDPSFAPLLTRSVAGAWACAVGEHVGITGIVGTELWASSHYAGRDHINNRIPSQLSGAGTTSCPDDPTRFSGSGAQYQAVALARDVSGRFEAWTDAQVPNRMSHLARTATYAGYAISILSEGYCQAVIEPNGPALDPPGVRAAAEEWFTKAIGYAEAAQLPEYRNLALLGRARMRLYSGDFDGAVQDAEQVPMGFSVDIEYSSSAPERYNRIWWESWQERHVTVHPSFRNLTVAGVPDPRVAVTDREAAGHDGITESWHPDKYESASSPVRMASWEEAQLIIAEARLGQIAVDRINAVRTLHGLPLYVPNDVSNNDEILNQVLEERRRELFLEGRWLNDMIRHAGRPGTAFDEGLSHQGVARYSEQYCIPLPDREIEANPNL